MSVKAIGIALKLTLSGMNQLIYPQTWIFTVVVITCVLTQMNYLNKVSSAHLWFLISINTFSISFGIPVSLHCLIFMVHMINNLISGVFSLK